MLLLSAIWLAAVHALASLAVPAGCHGPVGAPSRLGAVTATAGTDSSAHATHRAAPEPGSWALLLADGQFRAPAAQRPRVVDRSSDRSGPPSRLPAGFAAATPHLAHSPANLAPPAGHQLSHAAASRGGHLPYYPTAPPLQG